MAKKLGPHEPRNLALAADLELEGARHEAVLRCALKGLAIRSDGLGRAERGPLFLRNASAKPKCVREQA
jgi:hypothetical protein